MVALDWTSFFDDEQSMLSLNKVSFDACWLGKYNEANEGRHASYPGSECICIPLENRGLPQIPLTPAGNYPCKPVTLYRKPFTKIQITRL
jgi:hypothetical protein